MDELNEHMLRFMISYDEYGEACEIPLDIARQCAYPAVDEKGESYKFS